MKIQNKTLSFFQCPWHTVIFLSSFALSFIVASVAILLELASFSTLGSVFAIAVSLVFIAVGMGIIYFLLLLSGWVICSVSSAHLKISDKALLPNWMIFHSSLKPKLRCEEFLIKDIKDKKIRLRWHKNTKSYHLHLELQKYNEKLNKWEDELVLLDHQPKPWIIVDWINSQTGSAIDIHMSQNLRKKYCR